MKSRYSIAVMTREERKVVVEEIYACCLDQHVAERSLMMLLKRGMRVRHILQKGEHLCVPGGRQRNRFKTHRALRAVRRPSA
jgi:hypothetical protein